MYLVVGSKWRISSGPHKPCIWISVCPKCAVFNTHVGFKDEAPILKCDTCGKDGVNVTQNL